MRGISYRDAQAFADGVTQAWIELNISALSNEADRFSQLYAAVVELSRPTRYPSACQTTRLLNEAKALDRSLLSKLRPEASGPKQQSS
jgi:DNA helicase-4